MKIIEPKKTGPKHHFDIVSAVLSALGLVIIIIGLQTTSAYGWFVASKNFVVNNVVVLPQGSISPFLIFLAIGVLFNVRFYLSIRHRERIGKEPLLQTHILHNKTSKLGFSYSDCSVADSSGKLLCYLSFSADSTGLYSYRNRFNFNFRHHWRFIYFRHSGKAC